MTVRIPAVQADVVLRDAADVETDCGTHDKRDGLSLSLADVLGRAAAALVAVHHLMRDLMRQSRELLSRGLTG